MSLPHVPSSVPCANCGEMSPVVMSYGRQGEQLAIARMEGSIISDTEEVYLTWDSLASHQGAK
jgi:hypothetical protein